MSLIAQRAESEGEKKKAEKQGRRNPVKRRQSTDLLFWSVFFFFRHKNSLRNKQTGERKKNVVGTEASRFTNSQRVHASQLLNVGASKELRLLLHTQTYLNTQKIVKSIFI